MTAETRPMKFVPACKDFFGLKEGQTLRDFMDECKQLTEANRAEIKAGLEQNGYAIEG